MPSAAANFATRRPMLPTPTMPSVLPASSVLPTTRVAPQSPFRVSVSMSRVRLTQASMSISACSATAWEFEPGAGTPATPSRVAAGMSTVSRPTPCRPTTLSFVHAAIRLSVQLGRRRNSIPAASAATLASPASVSSSQTTTRASRSRSALPSGLIGPASTTRGRDSVAIGAGSFPSRTGGLFPGVEHEHAAWLERAPEAVDHQSILVVGEVTDRAEEVDREVELTREFHVPDVLADEPQGDAGLGGGLPRAVELGLAEVHARHLEAAAGKLDRVAAEPARGVEDPRAGLERRDPDDPLDVARRVRRRLERLRDLGPGLAEEPLALEHGGHCSGDREGGLLREWPEPGATRRCCNGVRVLGASRGWPEPDATRRCCNGVRVLGASRGWPEPGATRRCCNGVRVLGASRGWPEPGATRLRAACGIFRLMATLVTGACGCVGPGGGRRL